MKKILLITIMTIVTMGTYAQDWSWAKAGTDITPSVNPAKVKGTILTGGSGTIFPLASAVAVQFKNEGFKDQLTIENIGSGAGFKRFGAGELDVAYGSRGIKADEIAAVKALNKGDVVEFKIAIDALVILVNSKNTFLKDANKDQVKAIFGTATYWSDVNPSWPKEKINRYIPETTHGTFDYFAEHFWNDKGVALKAAANTQRFQDYPQLISSIEKDKNGIGFIGFDYFKESDKTNALSFAGVAPTKATVEKASYGISRFLYVYATTGTLANKPQVAAFVTYLLNNVNRHVSKVGFFVLPKADLDASKTALAKVIKGKY